MQMVECSLYAQRLLCRKLCCSIVDIDAVGGRTQDGLCIRQDPAGAALSSGAEATE